MTYTILLIDRFTKGFEVVQHFTGTKEALTDRLYDLQLNYCEDEKPTVIEQLITSNGRKLIALIANCEADFYYVSLLKKA